MSEESKVEIIDVETTFRNLKTVDDLNFDDLQKMVRGKTPEGIEQKCLQLCKDYLGGNWSQQIVDSIQVERITGGLVNQMYHCSIREPNQKECVPQEVSIKLHGPMNFDPKDKSKIKELVISLSFSEKNIGPKVYGIFEEGKIQKFYKHRQFKGDERKNPILVKKVFQTMARIHSLELPLKKSPIISEERIECDLKESYEMFPINDLIEEHKCETLKKYDLKTELNWIKSVFQSMKSPVIFTHNDFRSSNLLITEPNDELVVCDFDLSGYGYRGNDFSPIMREWGNRKQLDLKSIEGLPINDEFRPYIEIYVEECIRIHGKSYAENPINSVDHILKEAKLFLMFSYLFWAVMALRGRRDEDENTSVNYVMKMGFSEMNYKNYHKLKQQFKEQNIFD